MRVKVCGLTSVAEALACAEAGADWIGLNFHPASPRCVDPKTAAEIAAATNIAPGTVYKIIERAKKRGLVEQIGVRPRAPGSTGGGPEFIYRVVPGERARQLGTAQCQWVAGFKLQSRS